MSDQPNAFDPAARKAQISEGWDTIAELWDAWAPMVDQWFAPATTALLESTGIQVGQRVLELAAGSGGLTLHLARAVGPEGRVIATDVGPNMVKLAARNVRAAGWTNVNVRVMDGEAPDVAWASMDAVVCRQGFMFFGEPSVALGRLFQVLRPGGRLGLTVFATPDRNEFMSVPLRILSQWGKGEGETLRPREGPGPFSLSSPGRLEGLFRQAGFTDVQSRVVPSPLPVQSNEELLRFLRDVLGDLVNTLSPEEQTHAWSAVARAISRPTAPVSSGVPCEILVVSGARPTRTPGTSPISG